jgi:hypothetical protein
MAYIINKEIFETQAPSRLIITEIRGVVQVWQLWESGDMYWISDPTTNQLHSIGTAAVVDDHYEMTPAHERFTMSYDLKDEATDALALEFIEEMYRLATSAIHQPKRGKKI